MVTADVSFGIPASQAACRATFIPLSASGVAQPRMTSSIIDTSTPGARSTAALMVAAAISSGRVSFKVPRGALPTAVLTELTITASFISFAPVFCSQLLKTRKAFLVSEWFAGLEHVLNPLLSLTLAAERHKCLALEIQQVLLGDQSSV